MIYTSHGSIFSVRQTALDQQRALKTTVSRHNVVRRRDPRTERNIRLTDVVTVRKSRHHQVLYSYTKSIPAVGTAVRRVHDTVMTISCVCLRWCGTYLIRLVRYGGAYAPEKSGTRRRMTKIHGKTSNNHRGRPHGVRRH